MTAAGIGLIATVLGVRLLDGDIPLDRAFFVFLLTPEFYRPLRDLGANRHAALEGEAAAGRILEVLEMPGEESPGATMHPAPAGPLSLELDGVSFAYPERERPALDGITLTLPAGSCTALVGRSGSGKSTLVNLLLRSIVPTEGSIRANGVPLTAMSAAAWRERVALVSQRPYLFRGTVRENIRLARPNAGTEEVMRAAELAGCLPFIAELPGGLDCLIGERGERLSAGECQRLAIARAFLKDAPLLLLDEPTSALDPESEARIREALTLLMQGRTVLVVAHRLNTVRAADRVAVLDAGRLVEAGGRDALLRYRSRVAQISRGRAEGVAAV
jgi:ATP-binding cassette subfamily C protein CydD